VFEMLFKQQQVIDKCHDNGISNKNYELVYSIEWGYLLISTAGFDFESCGLVRVLVSRPTELPHQPVPGEFAFLSSKL